MHTWWDRESTLPEDLFTRYERVPDALPDLVGRWTSTPDPDGRISSLTVEADGSVVWEQPIQVRDDDIWVDGTRRLTGTGSLDPDTYFLNLTGATLTWIRTDGSVVSEIALRDHVARIPVAPTVHGIVASDPAIESYGLDDHAPFGAYWIHLERAE